MFKLNTIASRLVGAKKNTSKRRFYDHTHSLKKTLYNLVNPCVEAKRFGEEL